MLRLYFVALQFLTIVPSPFSLRYEKEDLGRSMSLFPITGMTLGLVLVGLDSLLTLAFPRSLVDLLLIVVLTVITGALHLDGMADVCDGLAARGGREKFLAVMKDSHTGAVGAVGLALVLLLKYQALVNISADKWQALLFFPMLARFSQVLLTVGAKRARQDGLGSVFIDGAGKMQLIIAAMVTITAGGLLLGGRGLACVGACCMATMALKVWFHRRLGGITGDIIGCTSELNEILCLLMLIATAGGPIS